MEQPETIEPEFLEFKKVHEIKLDHNKIRIELNNSEIIFSLFIDLSFNKHIKRFKINEFRTKYEISEEKNLEEIFNDYINIEYKINETEKKLIFGYEKEIKFEEEIKLTNEEMIKELILEIKNMRNEKYESSKYGKNNL